MQPALAEDAADFVLWVEDTCVSLGMDMRSVLCVFFPHLPRELKQKKKKRHPLRCYTFRVLHSPWIGE